ncbi:hypothetical protein KQJ29_32855, partial [Enterococcus sp. S181_ASV_20]|nr:hypothetical protein [Enterococcus sp. S181_ASV_20]
INAFLTTKIFPFSNLPLKDKDHFSYTFFRIITLSFSFLHKKKLSDLSGLALSCYNFVAGIIISVTNLFVSCVDQDTNKFVTEIMIPATKL